MSKPKKSAPKYLRYDDFIPVWQGKKPSLSALLQRSGRGSFPPAYRPGSQKAEPIWATEEVVKFIRSEFGYFWPNEVWEFEQNIGVKR